MAKISFPRMTAASTWLYAALAVFVIVYAVAILIEPRFGPTDDYALLSTLQQGKPFPVYGPDYPFYDARAIGRFTPLANQELNVVARFVGADPFWYFAFNVLELLVAVGLLGAMLRRATRSAKMVAAVIILFMLTPGFVEVWFRMTVQERNVFFYLSVFLFFYWLDCESAKWWKYALALLSANVALYYKEPVFVAIGVFAGLRLLARWSHASAADRMKDGILVASAAAYIVTYLLYVAPHRGSYIYSDSYYQYFLVLPKNVLNYALFSDPIIMLLVLPMAAWRIHVFLIAKRDAPNIYDSMLFAAAGYVLVFFALNMYGLYYFLPAYVFALPAVLHYARSFADSGPRYWKLAVGLVAIIFIVNTVPAGINTITYTKYLGVNFNDTVEFLVSDIRARHGNDRANIFFYGVDRGGGVGVYFILGEFLKYRGLSVDRFDLKSDVETPYLSWPLVLKPELTSSYTVFQRGELPQLQIGDYLIVTPQSEMEFDPKRPDFAEKYELLFRTESRYYFPNINLKILAKLLVRQLIGEKGKASGLLVNSNLTKGPDYLVYLRRR